MPRVARFVFPGLPFHVTQRGNRRCSVFSSDTDRRLYLELLTDYGARHGLEVLAYCLMDNHVHLVVVPSTRHALERVFRPLHMRHAQRMNRLRSWRGHLWQGRYFAAALDDRYLWTAVHYVERNPVVARMVERAEDYDWSSAAAHCGLRSDPVLTRDSNWARIFDGAGDWSAYLECESDVEELTVLRQNTARGLPCGAPEFIDELTERSGCKLNARAQGRPRTREQPP